MSRNKIVFSNFAWLVPLAILFFLFTLGIFTSYKNISIEKKKEAKANVKEGVAIAENKPTEEYLETESSAEKDLLNSSSYIKENGIYTSKEDVAAYINLYKKLPNNYISKKEAYLAGWEVDKNNLDTVLPGMSIGGDEFGNFDNKLPNSADRVYYEADIDYTSGARNLKRLVYSNDGLIFYTEDSYESFEKLY